MQTADVEKRVARASRPGNALSRRLADLAPWELAAYVALAVATMILVWMVTRDGAGIVPDSVSYRAIADSILAGDGPRFWLQDPMTQWPPGYPYVLAAVAFLTPLSVEAAGHVVSILAAGAAVGLTAVLVVRTVKEPWLRFAGVVFVALTPALQGVWPLMLSEPVFLVVVALFLLSLQIVADASASTRRRVGATAVAALLCWVAFMLRYAGIVFVGAGMISILLGPRSLTLARRSVQSVAFGVGAALVPAVWMYRNRALAGRVGPTRPSGATLGDAFGETLETVSRWFVPVRTGTVAAGFVAIIAILVAGAFAAARPGLRKRASASIGRVVPLLVFSVLHIGFTIYSRVWGPASALNPRFYAPVLIPLVVILCWIADVYVDRWRHVAATRDIGWKTRLPVYAAAAIGALFIVWLSGYSARAQWEANDLGRQLQKPAYTESAIVDALRADPSLCSDLSNNPRVLYRETGAETLPSKTELVREAAGRGDACLVWADAADHRWSDLDELRAVADLVPVATYPDGTIYEIREPDAEPAGKRRSVQELSK